MVFVLSLIEARVVGEQAAENVQREIGAEILY
jgi:hypothetical protein